MYRRRAKWQYRKNNVTLSNLKKSSEKNGTKILKKIKCTDFFGTRNVCIRGRIYPRHKIVRYLIQMYIQI